MTATTLPSKRRMTPDRIGALLGALAASVVAIVAVSRFVGADDRPAPVAVTAAPSSLPALITSLEERTRSNPDDHRSFSTLGSLYVRQAAATGDPAWYQLATAALERAALLAPEDPTTLTAQAGLALGLHDFEEAEVLAQRAVAAAPFLAEAHAVSVDAAVELGRYADAADRAQILIDLKPDAAALTRTSYLRELNGDLPGALDAMKAAEAAAIAEPAEHGVVAALVGDLELATGDTVDAAAAYDRALGSIPQLLAAELGLVRVAVAEGRVPAAEAALAELATRAAQPAVATLLAEVRFLLGDEAGATEAIELARAADRLLVSAGVVVDLESAIFEADHGDPALALEYASAAYATRSTIFTADAMAWALFRSNRAGDAVELVEQASRLGTVDPRIRVHAAAVHAATGSPDRARDELATAFAQAPWHDLSIRPLAAELAVELGLTVPAPWRP